ncbi:helix-turn-helix domain-containing protein, partial [Rhodopirellula baltica]|uniref:helix-turn-helix domain-containing protein n=1 Tax=Rhodopirellula baltica TaxID=265606 RepID=UPI0021BC2AD2
MVWSFKSQQLRRTQSAMAHLTFHQRVVISVMQRDGKKQKEIAEAIEVSPSTVSRELARNHITG